MTTLLKHSIIYFLVVLVVSTTGGVGVLYQGCSCDKDGDMLIRETSANVETGSADSCCRAVEEEPPDHCCGSDSQNGNESPSCPSSDTCCFTLYSYFKTDLANLADPVHLPLNFHFGIVNLRAEEGRGNESDLLVDLMDSDASPPLRYGKELLTSLHMLKADPLLA